MKKIIIILAAVLLISGLGVFVTSFMGNQLTVINSAELESLLNQESDSFFLYVGRPTCEVCQVYQPNLERAIKDLEETFYYYNTDDNREDENYESLIAQLDVTAVPALIYFEGGEIVDKHDIETGYSAAEIKTWIDSMI